MLYVSCINEKLHVRAVVLFASKNCCKPVMLCACNCYVLVEMGKAMTSHWHYEQWQNTYTQQHIRVHIHTRIHALHAHTK